MACVRCFRFVDKCSRLAVKRLYILSYRTCSTTTHDSGSTSTSNSDSEPQPDQFEDEDQQIKQRLLHASLAFVPRYGWTSRAISAGAEAEGMPQVAHGMFPRGGADLISFFYNDCNRKVAESMAKEVQDSQAQGIEKPKTRPFIANAVESRLRMILPYAEQWPQAMAIQTLPQNAMESWSNLAKLCDDIWYYAGDRSTDFNWYTKRISLAAAYKSTEIYMLQDHSEDFADTWKFLDRRLADLATFGKGVRNVQQLSSVFGDAFLGMCIVGRNVLGMNARQR